MKIRTRTDTADAPLGYKARKVPDNWNDPCEACAFGIDDDIGFLNCPKRDGEPQCMPWNRKDWQNVYFIRDGLKQCPYDGATRCIMDEPCEGCEIYAEAKAHQDTERAIHRELDRE